MSEGCEQVEREASITVTFVGCAEHGHFEPSNSHVRMAGIDAFSATDVFFATIEEALSIELTRVPMIAEWLSVKREWRWSPEGEQEELPDRTKQWLVRHLAHQLMLLRIAERGYQRERDSAFLRIPMD